MLNTSNKFVTTLIGNQSNPIHEIQKARHHGLTKIAELAEKIHDLYEPVKKPSLALDTKNVLVLCILDGTLQILGLISLKKGTVLQ